MVTDCTIWLEMLQNGWQTFISPIVDDEFSDFNYFRGNQYTKELDWRTMVRVKIVTADSIVYDTLNNGKTCRCEICQAKFIKFQLMIMKLI